MSFVVQRSARGAGNPFNEWPNLTATLNNEPPAGQLNFSVEIMVESLLAKATIISFHNRKQKNRDFQCEISSMKNLSGQKPIG